MPAKSLSTSLLEFALSYRADELPADLMDWAELRIIDTVGVAFACASFDLGTAATKVVLDDPSPGRSSLWATGGRTVRADDAAFGNGMLAHGMDYDDTHTTTTLHPGVVIVPAVLAVGERVGASGQDVLTAAVVGYEVTTRLGRLTPGRFQNNGFHPTSVVGIFGAVAAVSRLMELSLTDAVNAAGVAGSMASGLMEYLSDGSDAKQVHPGWAARGALTAVALARHGATGPATVLEGSKGVFESFARTTVDIADAVEGLGSEWVGTRVATKPYPACHCVHAPVDAWLALRERLRLTDDEVAGVRRITGLVPTWYRQLVCDPIEEKRVPRSVYEARFSLPFSIGLAVVDGGIGIDSYTTKRLTDRAVLDVASRVDYEVLEYEEFPEAFPGGVRVELADRTVVEEHVRHNVGSVANPMSDDQIRAKFMAGARRVGPNAAEQVLESLSRLRHVPSLGEFTQAMAAMDAGLGA